MPQTADRRRRSLTPSPPKLMPPLPRHTPLLPKLTPRCRSPRANAAEAHIAAASPRPTASPSLTPSPPHSRPQTKRTPPAPSLRLLPQNLTPSPPQSHAIAATSSRHHRPPPKLTQSSSRSCRPGSGHRCVASDPQAIAATASCCCRQSLRRRPQSARHCRRAVQTGQSLTLWATTRAGHTPHVLRHTSHTTAHKCRYFAPGPLFVI